MHPPKIFISATSGDLRSIRQIVKEALLTINCHPVEQTNFEPDARTVENMLRGKIGDCQALIHICGMRYGAEPDVATLPPRTPRHSYTQWEYHIGRQLQEERGDDHFRVYTFICPEDFPYDEEPHIEQLEKRGFQLAHRTHLFDSPHLWEKPADHTDLRLRILALQEQLFALKQAQAEVKTQVLENRYFGLKAFAILLLLLGGIYGGIHLLKRGKTDIGTGQEKIIAAAQPLDAPALRARLTKSSERTLQQELATADQAAKSADRQRLRDAAEAAHATRLTRIGDLAARLSELFATGQASPILVEMLRIVLTEGVDAALAYEEKHRPALLATTMASEEFDHEHSRNILQPVLKAAQFQASKGNSTVAHSIYRDLLALEPDWPEFIDAYIRFLNDTAVLSYSMGLEKIALKDAGRMHSLAKHRQSLSPQDPGTLHQLFAANMLLGEMSILNGLDWDFTAALPRSLCFLEVAEKVFVANPNSEGVAGEIAITLNIIGDYHDRHRRDGNADTALAWYQRSIEISQSYLTAHPDSIQAAKNITLSLEKSSDSIAKPHLPSGEPERAIQYRQRSLEVAEKFLAANSKSVEAIQLLADNLDRFGYFLAQRNQNGDLEKALVCYERSVRERERLLATRPTSADAARELSVSMGKLAQILVRLSLNLETGLSYSFRLLEVREKILASQPSSAEAAESLTASLNQLAFLLSHRGQAGDMEQALVNSMRSLHIRESLLAANPNSISAMRHISDSCRLIASIIEKTGERDADTWWRRAIDTLQAMEQKVTALSLQDKQMLDILRKKVGN